MCSVFHDEGRKNSESILLRVSHNVTYKQACRRYVETIKPTLLNMPKFHRFDPTGFERSRCLRPIDKFRCSISCNNSKNEA